MKDPNNLSKKFKVVHLLGGQKNSGAFKGAYLVHEALVLKGINSNIIIEEENSFFSNINRYTGFPYTQIYMYQDSS